MSSRSLKEEKTPQPYFEKVEVPEEFEEEGSRFMGPDSPYLLSGGEKTERYYLTHINDITSYSFNIAPYYFGNESSYTEVFPMHIKRILHNNRDARIFCVFDWDSIYNDETPKKVLAAKHKAFEKEFLEEIKNGNVVLCPSMPSIEYWFLLHFENYDGLLKNFIGVAGKLAPYMKPLFSDPTKRFSKLIKSEKFLKEKDWVAKLCADGKLDHAIKVAEENLNRILEAGELDKHSYSYVYKLFKGS